MKTRMIDGKQHCLIEEVGNQSLWEPCQTPQLAATDTSGELGLAIFLATVLGLGLTWGGSYVTARKSRYESFLSEIERGLK